MLKSLKLHNSQQIEQTTTPGGGFNIGQTFEKAKMINFVRSCFPADNTNIHIRNLCKKGRYSVINLSKFEYDSRSKVARIINRCLKSKCITKIDMNQISVFPKLVRFCHAAQDFTIHSLKESRANGYSEICQKTIFKMIKRAKNLEKLFIAQKFNEPKFQNISSMLHLNSKLEKLALHSLSNANDDLETKEGYPVLARLISNLKLSNLKVLHFNITGKMADIYTQFFSAGKYKNLREIEMHAGYIFPDLEEVLSSLNNFFACNLQLTNLGLFFIKPIILNYHDKFEEIYNTIKLMSSIEKLNLACIESQSSSVGEIFDNSSNIKSLRLDIIPTEDKEISVFTKLSNLKHVKELTLNMRDFKGIYYCESLKNALEDLRDLEKFTFSCNSTNEKQIAEHPMVQVCKSICHLNLKYLKLEAPYSNMTSEEYLISMSKIFILTKLESLYIDFSGNDEISNRVVEDSILIFKSLMNLNFLHWDLTLRRKYDIVGYLLQKPKNSDQLYYKELKILNSIVKKVESILKENNNNILYYINFNPASNYI